MRKAQDFVRQPGYARSMNRRDFLRLGTAATALIAAPVVATPRALGERKLAFRSTHTGEAVSATYWAEGSYQEEGLTTINDVLRDHRTNEIYPIDTNLLDMLHLLQSKTDNHHPFEVISGYRSPATNQSLSNKSSGVAKRSYHMRGMAIDIRLPGSELRNLHAAALDLRAGGVGYYPGSDFIHVDVGPTRSW